MKIKDLDATEQATITKILARLLLAVFENKDTGEPISFSVATEIAGLLILMAGVFTPGGHVKLDVAYKMYSKELYSRTIVLYNAGSNKGWPAHVEYHSVVPQEQMPAVVLDQLKDTDAVVTVVG